MCTESSNLFSSDLIQSTIKSGPSGRVQLMKNPNSDMIYIAKYFDTNKNPSLESFSDLNYLMELKHPFFIKILSYQFPDKTNNFISAIAMEYAVNGSLKDIIENNTSYDPYQILWEISRGMKFAHKNDIIHGNLKPSNILLDDRMHVKISDFKTSTNISNTLANMRNAPAYMAPELFTSNVDDPKSDVFSFGQIMIEVLSREPLFIGVGSAESRMMNFQLPQIPSSICDEMKALIEKCRARNPKDRPTFKEIEKILSHFVDPKVYEHGIINEYKFHPVIELCRKIYRKREILSKKQKYIQSIESAITGEYTEDAIFNTILDAFKKDSIDEALSFFDNGVDINITNHVNQY